MTDFAVRAVGEAEENDVYTIALGQTIEPDGETESVSFQCSEYHDEQDVARGEDTYCICYDPGQRAYYGGVHSWGLEGRKLVVRFDAGESDRFDLRQVDEDAVKKLEAGLTRVLVSVPRDDTLAAE